MNNRHNTISPGMLSVKLHELLVQDLDFSDSQINRFLDSAAMNIILNSLSQKHRIDFYRFLANDDYSSAKELVLKEIPDFNQKILKKVQDKMKEVL